MASPTTFSANGGHRRRRSSAAKQPPPDLQLPDSSNSRNRLGATSGLSANSRGAPLPAIPGTPAALDNTMSSRSPSPRPGGWSSPGLNTPYDTGGRASPMRGYANGSSHNVTWASAQAKSAEVKGYGPFAPRNQGFLGKHFRRISNSLPFSYADKEKLGRGRYQGNNALEIIRHFGRSLWRLRRSVGLILLVVLSVILFYVTRKLAGLGYLVSPADLCSVASCISPVGAGRWWQQICRNSRS